MAKHQPTRLEILQTIFQHFQGMAQWTNSPDNFHICFVKAQALIEILEVVDCGSMGGFDQDMPKGFYRENVLYDRFLWLCDKYKQRDKIKPVCGFRPEHLRTFFAKLNTLRENLKGG